MLFLGEINSPLFDWLRKQEESVIQTNDKITAEFIDRNNVGFIVSYGYRHILKADVLNKLPLKAVNLHISYLPWNRGADPNLWSFIAGSPKGVTIHYLDEGVDTGDVIAQKEIEFKSDNETLATTYEKLQSEIQELFKCHWAKIKTGECKGHQQKGTGSLHKLKDKECLSHLLTDGWNTRISLLEEYAEEIQMNTQFWDKYDREIEEIRNGNKA